MKWLSDFLKLRKQNDYVKIILLFVLVAVWVIGSSVYNIVEIRKNLSKPTEYVLMVQGNSAKSGHLKNAGDVTGISNVTFQKSDTITVGNESIECLKVSKEYLENVYNVKETSGMRTFFLTPVLYKKIQKNSLSNSANMTYSIEEGEKKTGKFVKLENEMFKDEEIAFTMGERIDFQSECNEIRAYVTKRDIDGTQNRKLEKSGLTLENQTESMETDFNIKLKFTEAKYNILIGIICIVSAIIMKSMIKRK